MSEPKKPCLNCVTLSSFTTATPNRVKRQWCGPCMKQFEKYYRERDGRWVENRTIYGHAPYDGRAPKA